MVSKEVKNALVYKAQEDVTNIIEGIQNLSVYERHYYLLKLIENLQDELEDIEL